MNLPLLYYSWLKTQKGLVDDSVFYKLIFHWLRWSYNRVALVLTLQQKRSHSIWKHVGRVCVSFFLAEFFDWWVSWVFHSTASHAAHIDVNAALGRSAMAATTARCECWLCRRRRLCQNGLTFWWVETQKIVVVVVAKVMVGKTLWFRAFSLCLQLDLYVYYNLLIYINYDNYNVCFCVYSILSAFDIKLIYIYTHIELYLQDTATLKTAFESRPQQYHLAFPTSCVRKEVGETTPEKVGNLNQLQSI